MATAGKQLKSFTIGSSTFVNDYYYIGTNPTGGTANDTMAFWRNKGTCYAYFNTLNQVNGQPSQWGFVDSFVNEGNEVNQIWRGQDGKVYIRKANSSTTAMPSWTQIAPIASPAFTGTPTAPTNGTASTSDTQIATTAFVQNAINRRVPKTGTAAYTNDAATNVANNTYATYGSWKAPAAGTFIGYCTATFAANATGTRIVQLMFKGNPQVEALRVGTTTTGTVSVTVPFVRRASKNDTFGMRVHQNSGATLQVTYKRVFGIFITD